MNKTTYFVILLSLSLGLGACSQTRFPGAYRIDVTQGNIIKQSDLDALKLGMNKSQVRYLLGTPLAESSFSENSWVYFYSLRKGNGELIEKRIRLTFNEQELLTDIQRAKD